MLLSLSTPAEPPFRYNPADALEPVRAYAAEIYKTRDMVDALAREMRL